VAAFLAASCVFRNFLKNEATRPCVHPSDFFRKMRAVELRVSALIAVTAANRRAVPAITRNRSNRTEAAKTLGRHQRHDLPTLPEPGSSLRSQASEACYVVTKRFAAYLNVEMERARIELQDHRSICRFIVSDATALPLTSLLRRPQQELLRRGTLGTAA